MDKIGPAGNKRTAVLSIIFIILLVYFNSLYNSFVWDDYAVIVGNNFIKSWKNLPVIFSKNYLVPFVKEGCFLIADLNRGSGEASYRPVVTLSYFFDYSLWKLNPCGYHITSLLLHIANALLVYSLANLILKNRKIAWLSSLLFALHPVNSEAVNSVAFREDLLAFFFYISSFILYLKLDGCRPGRKHYLYAFSLAAFFLALFSKEMAVTLPVIIILYDYYFTPAERRKEIPGRFKSRYLGYIAILSFYLWVRFFLMANSTKMPAAYPGGSFYSNILTMSRVLATYIKWIFFPVDTPIIMPTQPYLVSKTLFSPWVLPSMALIAACLFAALKLYRHSKAYSFFILWFFIALLPVSNIIPLGNYAASRYLYIPSVGFSCLVAIFLANPDSLTALRLSPGLSQKIIKYLTMSILIFYSLFTFIRNIAWRNDTVFFLEMTERYPDNAITHLGLGDCFGRMGLADKALEQYKIAIKINPHIVEAYGYIGLIFKVKKQYAQAIDYFKQALKIDPDFKPALDGLKQLKDERH